MSRENEDGPEDESPSAKPLRAPPWPPCSRCGKPSKPSEREYDERGRVYCSGGRCGTAEVEEVSQKTLHAQVLERDGGKCSECGEDCLGVRQLAETFRARGPVEWEKHLVLLEKTGFDRHSVETGKPLWQADHVDPRVSGGPTTLWNGRTLCLPCHYRITGELATARAAKRRSFRRT